MATDTSRFPGSLSRPLHTSPNSPLVGWNRSWVRGGRVKKIIKINQAFYNDKFISVFWDKAAVQRWNTNCSATSCYTQGSVTETYNKTCWRCRDPVIDRLCKTHVAAIFQLWEPLRLPLPDAAHTLIAMNFFPSLQLHYQYTVHTAVFPSKV